jgi:hypothetical protein
LIWMRFAGAGCDGSFFFAAAPPAGCWAAGSEADGVFSSMGMISKDVDYGLKF